MRKFIWLMLFSATLLRPAEFSYDLEQPAQVTLVIEDSAGRRVRNLTAVADRPAGRILEKWDGRNDRGEPVAPGVYYWRGLSRPAAITAHWLGAFYSPGSTPWKQHTRPGGWNMRPTGAGGWLSDHQAPYCVYTDDRHVYLGCNLAEAGDAIIKCDLDGKKLWGTLWLGLSGAHVMRTDGDTLFVASEGGWMGKRMAVNRFDVNKYSWIANPPEVKKRHIMHDSAFVRENTADFSGISGITLTPEHIVLALNDKKRLAYFDRKTALFVREEPLTAEKQRELENLAAAPRSRRAKVFHGRATDADGNLYLCDKNEQCVKVFAPDGKFLRNIGTPGGRQEGRYDPRKMGNPEDVAVDARGNVWVCENCLHPKRVSVWTRDGKLVREFVGTPFYGGGGSLQGEYAYYAGMRFRLRPDFSGADLDAVLWNPLSHRDLPDGGRFDKEGPSTVVTFRQKKYLVADNGYARGCAFIGEEVGDRLEPRVICGREKFPGDKGRPAEGVFLWQNGRKTVSRNFVYGAEWGMPLGRNLEIILRTADRKALAVLRPAEGVELRYDFARAEIIPLPEELQGFCALSPTPDGESFIINRGGLGNQGSPANVIAALNRKGEVLWTYPNPYPSNGHNSPLPRTGELRHTLGIEGYIPTAAGTLFSLNGNKGTRYLFTTDGFFAGELFGDMRVYPQTQNFSRAERGMLFSDHSLGDECFSGWLGMVRDRPMMIAGKDSLNLCELKGLDNVQRLPGGIVRLTRKAPPLTKVPMTERGPARTVKAGGFGLGHTWWKMAEYAFPADNPVARFAMGWSESSLILHYDVTDATPFVNAGDAPHTLFHSGDALDFRWEGDPRADPARKRPAAGDQRLVIAPLGKEIAVMRYVYVDPAAKETPQEFVSPAGRIAIARIERVEKAKVSVVRRQNGYQARIDIPWSALGEKEFKGGIRRADPGVIFGDATGSRVIRRQYLFDPGSQEVSDIPSEMQVDPSAWGKWEF